MFKVLTEGCNPSKGSKYSAAIDLYASEDITIGAGETGIVGLGVCIDEELLYECSNKRQRDSSQWQYDNFDDFMESHYIQLEPRSSLRAKGLIVGTGIIDLDYEDELKLIVHNPVKHTFIMRLINEVTNKLGLSCINSMYDKGSYAIKKGDKIAQVLLKEHKSYLFDIDSGEERTGGIGSTDDNRLK